MSGNMIFPAFCLVVLSVQLTTAYHSHFMHPPPRTSPRSWGIPNEIFGSTGAPIFRPTPAVPVLIAGHGPPVARHNGPVRHGRRPLPSPFPLMTSTPIPLPSSWPNQGAQIQRAQETSHYEYEVNPPFPKPPTLMRAGPPRRPPQFLVPTQMPPTTTSIRPDMFRAIPRDILVTTSTLRPQRSSSPPPPFMLAQRSTSPPPPFVITQRSSPPPFMVTGPPRGGPPYATPSDAEFQEGFRILHDLFMEDAGADIRSNLVGGTDVSFSGGYFPPVNGVNNTNSVAPRPTQQAPPSPPQIEITPAKEQGILMAGSPPKNEDSSSSEEEKAPAAVKNQDQEKQGTEISYGPPHFQHGPPEHTSFMFSDPHEPGATYNLYDSDNSGYQPGPPPPFHSVGNSILPQPLPPSREQMRGPPPPPPPQPSQDQGPPARNAPQSQGGYNRGPPPPPVGNSLRSGPPPTMTPPVPMPMMMMPLGEQPTGNEPPPSSDEIQKALGVLARFASKQAHNMGMAPGPHMGMLQMMQGPPPPNTNYGPPQPEQASTPANSYGAPPPQQNTPSTTYGSPAPQQTPAATTYNTQPPQPSSPIPNFLSVEVTPPPPPSSSSGGSTTNSGYTTTETADAITISDSPEDPVQSSPFPSYGPPQTQAQGGYGGYQGNVEYSTGGGWGQDDMSGGGGLMVLKNLGNAVTGGIRQVGALKAGILNAGLNVIGGLGHAKGDIANSLKIPVMPKQQPMQGYGWAATTPTTTTTTASTTTAAQYGPPAPQYGPSQPQYGPPQGYGWGPETTTTTKAPGLITTLLNAGRQVVGGVTGTVAKTGKAAVGIGLSKNQYITNHIAIKGQAFTDLVSKKVNNKNDYFLNVMKHIASIFATTKKPSMGWSRR